ncbi:hypothetical protein [Actinoallomurus sp. CA-150999]|uniref:hypothetical protein n=1 Tax=Actinoallomurus sp. CA-150999 TaxID=3239887 RepID=UPI003D8A570F
MSNALSLVFRGIMSNPTPRGIAGCSCWHGEWDSHRAGTAGTELNGIRRTLVARRGFVYM